MDSKVTILSLQGMQVSGTLRTTTGADALVIFVHGFLSHQNEHIFFNGSKHLSLYGYDSFRFDLYDTRGSQRRLEQATMQHRADILTAIIAHYKPHYRQIHLIGHSLGCPQILLSDVSGVSSLTFWEPSVEPSDLLVGMASSLGEIVALTTSRYTVLVSARLIDEALALPTIKCLLGELRLPVKIIGAGRAGWRIGREVYFRNANSPKEIAIISHAGHNFDEDGAEEALFIETVKWLRACLKSEFG